MVSIKPNKSGNEMINPKDPIWLHYEPFKDEVHRNKPEKLVSSSQHRLHERPSRIHLVG